MRFSRRALIITVASFVTLALACNQKVNHTTQVAPSVDPDQLLRQMSATLSEAKQLTFKVTRRLDAALIDGRDVPETAQIEVAVTRPNKFMAISTSRDDVRRFYFDGQNLSLFDETMQHYATVVLPGTIDELVSKINQQYGFTPPLAEFAVNDPYAMLNQHIQNKSYKGKEVIGGVECHHLALIGEVADAELWFGTGDSLPRKLLATFKDREGSPQVLIDFSDWNITPNLEVKMFAFVAPKDAEKIEMVSVDQVRKAEGDQK